VLINIVASLRWFELQLSKVNAAKRQKEATATVLRFAYTDMTQRLHYF
jgi:hypothetical protein